MGKAKLGAIYTAKAAKSGLGGIVFLANKKIFFRSTKS